MRLSLSSLLVLPLLSVASASSQVILSSPQVYLHPSPPSAGPPPTLSEEQAQAVIGHHLGASRHHQLPALGDWTKLLGVGHGVVGGNTGEDKARVLVVQGVGYPQGELRPLPLGHRPRSRARLAGHVSIGRYGSQSNSIICWAGITGVSSSRARLQGRAKRDGRGAESSSPPGVSSTFVSS